jgi:hypothetical protein
MAMREARMRRVIGIDIHRTFGEVVIWERGMLRHVGRVDMTRTALEGLSGIPCVGERMNIFRPSPG